jgi:hypothetical protein
MMTEYLFLDDVPPHVPFSCSIEGDTFEFKLSYDDPDHYNYLDDLSDNSYIEKEYLMWHWPFRVLDTDHPVE